MNNKFVAASNITFKFFLKSAVVGLIGLLLSVAAEATVTLSYSSTSATGSYTIGWSISGNYMLAYETTGGTNTSVGGGTGSGTISITGKQPGTYTYLFNNYCSKGSSPVLCDSTTATITVLGAPSNPTINNISLGNQAINLSWSAPAQATSYQVTRSPTAIPANSSSSPSYNDNYNLTPNTTYTYTVKACNSIGCSIGITTSITYPATPSVPNTFSANPSGANVNLSWSNVGASTYVLLRNGTNISGNLSSGTYSFTDTGAAAGATSSYTLQACNAANVCSTTATSITLPRVPQPSISATLVGIGINVNWNSDGASTVQILRNGSAIGFSGSSLRDTNITSGVNYTYTISACNANNVCGTSSASVSTPSNLSFSLQVTGNNTLSAYVYGASSVAFWNLQYSTDGITWISVSGGSLPTSPSLVQADPTLPGGNYQFRIYYGTQGGTGVVYNSTPIQYVTLAGTPAPPVPNPVTTKLIGTSVQVSWAQTAPLYEVSRTLNGTTITYPRSAPNTYTDSAVSFGNTYTYSVKACNTTGECSVPVSVAASTVVPASVPTIQVPVSSSSTGIYDITWSGGTANASYYKIIETNNGSDTPYTVDAAQPSLLHFTSKANGSYTYKVTSCNGFGCNASYSAAGTIDVAVLGAMSGSVGGSLNPASGVAQVTWGGATGATVYNVVVWNNTTGTAYATANINAPAVSTSFNVTAKGVYVFKVTPHAKQGGFDNVGATISSSATYALDSPSILPVWIAPIPTLSTTGSYTLNWNSVSNATYYVVNQNGVDLAANADGGNSITSGTSFNASNKSNGTYTYKIKACNVAGCAASYSETYTINVAQTDPVSNVQATLLQNTGVTTLTWAPVPPTSYYAISTYSIQVKLNGSNYGSPVYTTSPGNTFPAVTDAGNYTYDVKACVNVGGQNYCSTAVTSNQVTPIQPDTPLLSAPLLSGSGFYSVTWNKSLWATHYKLFENSVLIQDTAEWSKVFAVLNGKTNGTYIYQVQACFVVCSPLSNIATTTVTLVSKTTNPANSSGGTAFNFASEAPSNFTYDLTKSGIPDLGQNQFVAATQGNINVSNGAAQYSVKLDLPPAIRDLKPSLSLSYNSRGGNGLMGVGWNLSGLSSITRCRASFATEGADQVKKSNPKYSTGDRLCLDGQKLVLNSVSTIPASDSAYWALGSEYKTEIDNFSRIVAYSSDAGAHAYFKVFTKDGRTLIYGEESNSQNSRIRKPGAGNTGAIGSWLLDKVEDAYGNSYTITYLGDNANGNYYPDRINFTPNSVVKFNYQNRNGQVPTGYDMGGYYKYPQLLQNVTTYVDVASPNDPTTGVPVKQYQINYKLSATTQRDLVDTLAECGWSNGVWQCAKPLTFAWQQGEQGFNDSTPISLSYCGGGSLPDSDAQGLGSSLRFIDLDEDGYSDGITASGNVFWGTASGCFQQGDWVTGDLKGLGSYIKSVQPFRTASGLALFIKRETNSGITRSIGIVYGINKGTQSKSYMELNSVNKDTDFPLVYDINNDGLPDVWYMGSWAIQNNTPIPSFTGFNIGTQATDAQSFYDIDGDGIADKVETWQNSPTDGTYVTGVASSGVPGVAFLASPPASTTNIFLGYIESTYKLGGSLALVGADLNGDGNRDFFYHHLDANGNSNWLFRMNMQSGAPGSETPANQTAAIAGLGYNVKNHYGYAYDYDKDGKDDLVVIVPDGPNKCKSRFLLSRNFANGISFQEAKDSNGQTITSSHFGGCSEVQTAGLAGVLAGDINNDGAVDIYWIRDHVAYFGRPQQPDLMTVVTDGFGAQTQLEYSTLTGDDNHGKALYTPDAVRPSFPQVPASRGMQVVKKLSTSDSKGGFNDRFFNYTGARTDVQGRGFLGFATIQVTDLARSTTSITNYHLDFPFTGRVDTVTTQSVNWDNLISSVKNVYAVHSGNPRFPYLDYSIQQNYHLSTSNSEWPLSVTKVKNTYDTCGNLTEQVSDTGTSVSNSIVAGVLGHKRIHNDLNYYGTPNDCSDDFTFRTTQETSKTSLADDFRSVVTEYTPTNSSANTVKEVYTVTSNKGTALESTTTINRNSSGLVTGSQQVAKDIDGGTTATRSVTTSNFARGMYPQTVTSVLSGGDLVTNTRYDYRFGEANYVKTPNGLATTREFDPLGRVINEYLPDMSRHELIAFDCATVTAVVCPEISGSDPSVRAAYGVATKVTNSSFANNTLGAPLTITYYDSLQRPVRSTTYTMNGNAINVDRVYTPEGNLSYVSEPFNTDSQGDGDSSKRTRFDDYDELGVPHTEYHADGGSRRTDYDRWDNNFVLTQTVTVVKSDGSTETQQTQKAINPLGQVDEVVDATYVPVNYSYNSQGGLETTRVNNNYDTQVSIAYDAAGNKSHMVDPDAGAIDFEYNGFGELRRQTWQKGTAYAKSMTLSYDQLGRQLTRVDQPVSGNATTYNWVWDTQQPGLLASESGNGQTISYLYDELGRPNAMTTSISGLADKIFSYSYDAYSRPATVTYPNGLTIQRVYHGNGMAVQTRDVTDQANPKVLWALGSDVDGRGSFTNQLWGNGVATQTTFDALSGQLQSIKSGHLTSTNTIDNLKGDIQNLNYTFDSLGNLESRNTQRTNAAGVALENTTERFTYDALNRLKTSTASGLFARYNSYGYDELGNLRNRTSYLGSSSTNDDVGVLAYAGTNNAGVHAVTSAGGINYQYDKYGNMTQRGSESITYDVFNKPIIISNSTTTTNIFYDANHDRFKESDGSKTTYSIAGGLYEEDVSGSTSTQKSYIDGVIINTKVFNSGLLASNDTQYLHTDHLGSVDAISDKFGAFVTRMSFSDWGNRQKSDWSTGLPTLNFPTQNGYTGHHEMDKHNLVHMGGRVYDPTIGRFLSADLFIQSPYSTQSYNRYSYVFNNPLSNTDPTGYCNNHNRIFNEDGSEAPSYDPNPCDGPAPMVLLAGADGGPSMPKDISVSQPLQSFNGFNQDYKAGEINIEGVPFFGLVSELSGGLWSRDGDPELGQIDRDSIEQQWGKGIRLMTTAGEFASPFKLIDWYRKATLAGKSINLSGKINEHHLIPTALYKQLGKYFDPKYWHNSPMNKMDLPNPFHANHPSYSARVREELKEMLTTGKTSLKDIERLQNTLRDEIKDIYSKGYEHLNDYYKGLGYKW